MHGGAGVHEMEWSTRPRPPPPSRPTSHPYVGVCTRSCSCPGEWHWRGRGGQHACRHAQAPCAPHLTRRSGRRAPSDPHPHPACSLEWYAHLARGRAAPDGRGEASPCSLLPLPLPSAQLPLEDMRWVSVWHWTNELSASPPRIFSPPFPSSQHESWPRPYGGSDQGEGR